MGYLLIQSQGEEEKYAIKTGMLCMLRSLDYRSHIHPQQPRASPVKYDSAGVNVVGRKGTNAEWDRRKAQEWDAQFVDHAVSGEYSCALFSKCSFGLSECHSPVDLGRAGVFLDDASMSATHAAFCKCTACCNA